jgi:hypothetical protein
MIGMQSSLIPVSCTFVARLGREGRNRVGNGSIQPRILVVAVVAVVVDGR